MSATAVMLLLVPLWPGILGLVALALHKRRLGGLFALTGALPALAVGIFAPIPQDVFYPWLLLGTRLGVDAADHLFLLFTAIVWLMASSFAFFWIQRRSKRERFFAFFLLAMSGNLGALVAQDMPSFYAFFALMSFAAYGLIAHDNTPGTQRAARVYIVLVVVGEAMLALAMILAAGALGTIDFAAVRSGLVALPNRDLIIACALLGFGIKAGVLLLHVWLPLAHPVAPVPASAVLSGTIIVTGLVGWLRFLPVGVMALPGWGGLLIAFGLGAAFYGALVGIDQHNPKVVLAYSSVSQMGIMTIGIGMMLLEPILSGPLSIAIAFFALHHGLAKSALFLGAGLERTRLDAARRRRLVIGLVLPSLALAGAPLTSGMLAKSALVVAEASLPEPWGTLLRWLLPFTSVITALLMARFLVLVSRGPEHPKGQVGRAPWIIWYVSLGLVLFLPWWLRPGTQLPWNLQTIIGSLWPLGLALATGLAAVWAWRRAGRPVIPEIPQGDVLLPLEHLLVVSRDLASSVSERARTAYAMMSRAADVERARAWALIQRTSRIEALLNRWEVAMVLAALLGVVLALVAMR